MWGSSSGKYECGHSRKEAYSFNSQGHIYWSGVFLLQSVHCTAFSSLLRCFAVRSFHLLSLWALLYTLCGITSDQVPPVTLTLYGHRNSNFWITCFELVIVLCICVNSFLLIFDYLFFVSKNTDNIMYLMVLYFPMPPVCYIGYIGYIY